MPWHCPSAIITTSEMPVAPLIFLSTLILFHQFSSTLFSFFLSTFILMINIVCMFPLSPTLHLTIPGCNWHGLPSSNIQKTEKLPVLSLNTVQTYGFLVLKFGGKSPKVGGVWTPGTLAFWIFQITIASCRTFKPISGWDGLLNIHAYLQRALCSKGYRVFSRSPELWENPW